MCCLGIIAILILASAGQWHLIVYVCAIVGIVEAIEAIFKKEAKNDKLEEGLKVAERPEGIDSSSIDKTLQESAVQSRIEEIDSKDILDLV